MLIREWMSRPVISIDQNDSLTKAMKLFGSGDISALPVFRKGSLVGIVSDGDVKKAAPSDATTLDRFEMPYLLETLQIKTIMSHPVVTIHEDHTVEEAAGVMLSECISGLPVLNRNDKLEGIITKSDIFRCFVSFTGVSSKGQIFVFKLKDRPGAIKEITDNIRRHHGRLHNVMTSYDNIDEGFRKVYIHAFDIDPADYNQLLQSFHKIGGLFYAADLSRNIREIVSEYLESNDLENTG